MYELSRNGTCGNHAADICVVTCYFNPKRFASKRQNFEIFREGMRQYGAPLYVTELATPNGEFELDESPNIIRVRSASTMWQKEKLLNIAINRLPAKFTKVIWADCDLKFDNRNWLVNASSALDKFTVIQPFTEAVRLPPRQTSHEGSGRRYQSFASVILRRPKTLRSGNFAKHGHTGFAWGGRRDWLLECGLYECCISGSGDHLMAHAFCGDYTSPCVMRTVGNAFRYHSHFREWAKHVFELTGGNFGVIEGTVLHLWHGDPRKRQYGERDRELCELDFDPKVDLRENQDGCWELTDRNPVLPDWVNSYYDSRDEDNEVLGRWGGLWPV